VAILAATAGASWAAGEAEYVTTIVALIDPAKLATLGPRGANPRVQKCVYWLETARRERFKGEKLLEQALAKVGMKGAAADLTREAVVRNWKAAKAFGCLNPEGLEAMRHGQAATIRKGRYKGQELSVDHVVPRAVVPELDHVIANLAFMPLRLNEAKNERIGPIELALARKLNKAGLLSGAGLQAVESAARPGRK
jgi:hypothetical protein